MWFWEDEAFHVHALREGGYEEVPESAILPGLDLAVVARFTRTRDQHQAAKAFRDGLRKGQAPSLKLSRSANSRQTSPRLP